MKSTITAATTTANAGGVGATRGGWVARRGPDGGVEVAATPARVGWAIDGLTAADGHELAVTFGAAVTAVDEPAERQLLAETFLTGAVDAVAPAGVVEHLAARLRQAAGRVAAARPAAALLADDAKPAWTEALRAAADAGAFAAGLEVLAPYELAVTSPTLQRERLEQMQRTAAERRSAGRVEHFARAAELVKQWDALQASVPSLTPGRVLQQVTAADRGAMLETLLMASGSAEQGAGVPCLWAVAGPSLVRIDSGTVPPAVEVMDVPTTAGPLRSVSADVGRVLVGARTGVLVIDAKSSGTAEVYLHPGLATEHGFTTPTIYGDLLRACHRDAGLVTWRRGETAKPAHVATPNDLGGDAKHLARGRDGWSLFAVGSRVMKVDEAGRVSPAMTAAGTVVAVLNAGAVLIVVTDDGTVTRLDGSTLDKQAEDRYGTGKVTGAALLPWLTTYRLLLLPADGPVECVGLEDQLLTQYAGGPVGLRAAAASAGRIAGVSGDRQKVLVWDVWDGRRIAAEVHVAAATRHRVADVAFG